MMLLRIPQIENRVFFSEKAKKATSHPRSHNVSSVTLSLLKVQAVHSCRVIIPVKACVSLKERNISFVNCMKYFDMIAERKPT
jgi:hypothetical protein